MKRIAFIILLMAAVWQVEAQRPVIPAGSPGYMFMPSPTEDSVIIKPNGLYHNGESFTGFFVHDTLNTYFFGDAYRSPSKDDGVTVYGVATVTERLEWLPYLWVYLLKDTLVDSVNLCYAQDTLASELFCFIDHSPVSYADFSYSPTMSWYNGRRDTFVMPFYEFYFSTPVHVPAGARFYVGVRHSLRNKHNRIPEEYPNHFLYYDCPDFYSNKRTNYYEVPSSCHGDGLDSTWNLRRDIVLPTPIDWGCNRCRAYVGTGFFERTKYHARGFSPIIRPPEDSSRIFPIHDHPLRPARVEGFRLTGLDMTQATFAWDTIPPSEWGPVGVNVDAYEVNYAPYMQEYRESDTVISAHVGCTLARDFDTTVMYKARCRARSRHVCDIHRDTVWGDWSEEVYFHTGVGEPDTVPLECVRVEGLRHSGMLNGHLQLEWERAPLHDRYEVQLWAAGGDGWHRDGITVQTRYALRAELDSNTLYMIRVRAICDHHCHVHDTLMTGGWSDTLTFSLGPLTADGPARTEGGLFVLSPNPARHTVAVRHALPEAEYPARLTVSDTKGREVSRHTLAGGDPLTLEVGALPAGAYLVTLTTRSRRTETQRLVVEP